MIKQLKNYLSPFRKLVFSLSGKKPWSYGYNDTRWDFIEKNINDLNVVKGFNEQQTPVHYGLGMDERVVEYPWIISKLNSDSGTRFLDAGSTFNFKPLITHPKISNKHCSIFTYYPEPNVFVQNRVSYDFGDLRHLPYKNELFDEIVCQSTIEHIDMDNSIYGYELSKNENVAIKSYEYLLVVKELVRVLNNGGKLLITFPYGVFENHGFFQQFDAEMTKRIIDFLQPFGKLQDVYLLYTKDGWRFAEAADCNDSTSYNPHTGKGKGSDGAAHCRCVCCIEFIKSK